MRRSKDSPCTYMVSAIRVLACGFIFTSVLGSLHAQQQTDPSVKASPGATDNSSSVPASASDNHSTTITPETLTFSDRLKIYAHSFISPQFYIGPALGAGIGQWDDRPHEWGEGAEGYGLRYGSGFGRSVISNTIALGVASVDHEDTRFFQSNEHGVWRRTRHAVIETFVARTGSGGSMPAYSTFTGVYGAAFIANAWQPPSVDNIHDAFLRGTTGLLSNVGWHVFEEFWPDIHNTFHHKHN
jgi:hypothetical protein